MDAMECRRSLLGTKRAFGAYPSLQLIPDLYPLYTQTYDELRRLAIF